MKQNVWKPSLLVETSKFGYPASQEELTAALHGTGAQLPALPVGRTVKVKYGTPVQVKLGAEHHAIIDQLVQSGVMGPGFRTKSDLVRAAVHWYISTLVSLLNQHRLETIWAQGESIKRMWYAIQRRREINKVAEAARMTAKVALEIRDEELAREVLWEARRMYERLGSETERESFDVVICGPADVEEDQVRIVWKNVLSDEVTKLAEEYHSEDAEVVDPKIAKRLAKYELGIEDVEVGE